MALRQNIPGVVPGFGLYSGDKNIIKRVRPPTVHKHRADAPLKELMSALEQYRSIAVEAAVGAGKSTRLPYEISESMAMLVVQVVPSDYLAYDLAEYVSSTGVDCVSKLDPLQEWPERGVVILSAACLVAHWIANGKLDMPRCILFHDESHESDAYTMVVRYIWSEIAGIQKYVSATATAGPADYRTPKLPSPVEHRTYSADLISADWDPLGAEGHPWEIDRIHDNTLIFEDSKVVAERLVSAYNLNGFVGFRLHSRMKMAQFQAAMREARLGQNIVVLVADSTFRSGYSMPVSVMIDSAVVASVTIDGSTFRRENRDAYSFERYQAAGRVGRLAGRSAVVWASDAQAVKRMVTLEDADAEAAALLFRVLGKAVPNDCGLLDTVMSEGKVPRDLIAALQGSAPLTTLHDNLLETYEKMSTPEGRRSPMIKPNVRLANADTLDYENHSVSADVARNYKKSSNGGWESRDRSDSGYGDSESLSPDVVAYGVADAIREMAQAAIVDDVELLETEYYCAPSMPKGTKDHSPMFPDGYDSVVRIVGHDSSRSLQLGMSATARWVAVHALLRRHNVLSCELNAAHSAVRDVSTLAKGRDSVAIRDWVSNFMSRVGELQSEAKLVIECLVRVTNRFCQLEAIPRSVFTSHEQDMAGEIVAGIRCLPERALAMTELHAAFRQSVVDDVGDGLSKSNSLRVAHHSRPSSSSVLETVDMPRVGRGMRAIRAYSGSGPSRSNAMRKIGHWVATT